MLQKRVLVTGSAGLIGSESVKFFASKKFDVVGIDNNLRKYFFGEDGSTEETKKELIKKLDGQYHHYNLDIRDFEKLQKLFKKYKFDLVIHTAAQPSHDWAARDPLMDFSINAVGTHNILELTRLYSPDAVFIFTSTNKVYGDLPNTLPLIENKSRFELPKTHKFYKGIDESMSIDKSKHSIFGASKVAADIMVQEYGNYFGVKTAVFRAGCLTGPSHHGAKLHGFLAYLIKSIATDVPYTIFGYKGKQVRDNLHSSDLVNAFYHFYKNPKKGEVYNMGGSRFSNISMLEAIEKIENALRKKGKIRYEKRNRSGDHIWYISDVSKFKSHFPKWEHKYNIDMIIAEMCETVKSRI